MVCHCPSSNEVVELLDDEALEVRLVLVRLVLVSMVERVGNHPVETGGGGDPRAVSVAFGGGDAEPVKVILAAPVVV